MLFIIIFLNLHVFPIVYWTSKLRKCHFWFHISLQLWIKIQKRFNWPFCKCAWLQVFDSLLNGDVEPYPSFFKNATGCTNYFNYMTCQVLKNPGRAQSWLCDLCKHIQPFYNKYSRYFSKQSLQNPLRLFFFVNHRRLKTRSTSPSLWLSQLCDVPFMWGTWRSTTAQTWRSTFCRMSWRPSNRGWGCWWTTTGWEGCLFWHEKFNIIQSCQQLCLVYI